MTIHPAMLPVEDLIQDCSIKRTRGSGPGGQHRNKVETAIVITHLPTGIVGQASEKRSQHQNRRVAIERLRINLAVNLRSDSLNRPTPRWMSRVKSKKISVSIQHDDYPAVLAEALDAIAESKFDVATAAGQMQVSTSQLVKLLKSCPAAFESVNRQRNTLGLAKLS